jgi:cell division protein FtsI/penicillin-binding protein 2
MRQVVEHGTGKKLAELEHWTAFGKTGTAQIPSTTRGHPGYIDGAFTSTFVGGAPVEDPRAICLVSIHWPKTGGHYGATVAGPWFKEIMTKTLNYLDVPPDKDPTERRSDGHERYTD